MAEMVENGKRDGRVFAFLPSLKNDLHLGGWAGKINPMDVLHPERVLTSARDY